MDSRLPDDDGDADHGREDGTTPAAPPGDGRTTATATITSEADSHSTASAEREICSWYWYDVASSVYAAPAMAMLNNLQQLAAWNSCDNLKKDYPNDPTKRCDKTGAVPEQYEDDVFPKTDIGLAPASVTFLVIGISVLCQAVAYISLSAYADYGRNKKTLLKRCLTAGCVCGGLFVFCVDPGLWWACSLLIVSTGVFFGLAVVYYNAYLPLMVRSHPKYRNLAARVVEGEDEGEDVAPSTGAAASQLVLLEEKLTDEISTKGFAYGYLASAVACVVCLAILFFTAPEKDSSRDHYTDRFGILVLGASSALCAGFWLVAGLRSANGLEDRDGPDLATSAEWRDCMEVEDHLPKNHNDNQDQGQPPPPRPRAEVTCWSAVVFSWRRTFKAVQLLWKPENKTVRRFMIGYFLYSDGYSTIANAGIIYAQSELDVTPMWLGILLVEVVFFNYVGVKFFHWLFSGASSRTIKITGSNNNAAGRGEGEASAGVAASIAPAVEEGAGSATFGTRGSGSLKPADGLQNDSEPPLQLHTAADAFPPRSVKIANDGSSSDDIININSSSKLQQGTRAKTVVLVLLSLYMISSLIAFFTLHYGTGMFLFFGFCHGMLLGAIMSYTRVLFSSLVPKGLEAQLFALYEISDKGSSWIGPCVLAVISQFTSVRWGFCWVFFAFAAGAGMLYPLKLDETAKQRGKNFK